MSTETAKNDITDQEDKPEDKQGMSLPEHPRLRPGPNRQSFEDAVEATLRQHEAALRILAGEVPEKSEEAG